jgi:hypothetical protein
MLIFPVDIPSERCGRSHRCIQGFMGPRVGQLQWIARSAALAPETASAWETLRFERLFLGLHLRIQRVQSNDVKPRTRFRRAVPRIETESHVREPPRQGSETSQCPPRRRNLQRRVLTDSHTMEGKIGSKRVDLIGKLGKVNRLVCRASISVDSS